MFKEMAQLGSLLKQAQSLSGRMGEVQERLAAVRVTGRSPDGTVEVEVSGSGQAVACRVAPEVLQSATTTALEAAIVYAVNDAFGQVQQQTASQFADLSNGLDLGALGSALGKLGIGPKS